jgi:tRNA threonylcarbamoyl adenosine modification protein YeaZ
VLVLALDTSSAAVTVAVARVDPDGSASGQLDVVAERSLVASNRHGELLAPLIRDALSEADETVRDLTAVAVGLGPGPFTGLRVGIMTAKAIGDAGRVPVYARSSLDVIAAQHAGGGQPFAVLTDARRKQVYWARYDGAGVRLDGPELDRPADLAEALRGQVTQLVGAGAILYRDDFDGFAVVEDDPWPVAGTLALLVRGQLLAGAVGDDLTPLYLRRPDAQPPGRPKQVTPA